MQGEIVGWNQRVILRGPRKKGREADSVESGYYLDEMAKGMYVYQREIENGERVIIGVNKYALEEEIPIKIFRGDPGAEEKQIERLRSIKGKRSDRKVRRRLEKVRKVAEEKAGGKTINIIPSILSAVEEYASIGEIFHELREVFGEYRPITRY